VIVKLERESGEVVEVDVGLRYDRRHTTFDVAHVLPPQGVTLTEAEEMDAADTAIERACLESD
jgi:hypothetical protein